jgi:hypothetical protein
VTLKIQQQDLLEIASSILDSDIVIPFRLVVGLTPADHTQLCNSVDTIIKMISRWKTKGFVDSSDLCDFMYAELMIFGKTPKSDLILEGVAMKHSLKFAQSLRMQVAAMVC